jgi:glycine cleavage system H protein
MEFPSELKYTDDHEWLRRDGEEALVGITAFAATQLGDIVYLDLQPVDLHLQAGDVFGFIEAVKTVSDLFMPVSGVVMALNEKATSAPEILNADPYGENSWLIRIRPDNPAEMENLMDDLAYRKITGHD